MFLSNTPKDWDKRAKTYGHLEFPDVHMPALELLKSLEFDSILDIGCFTGGFPYFNHYHGKRPKRYLGIDYSPTSVFKAITKCGHIKYAKFEFVDFEKFIPEQEFDVIHVGGFCWYYRTDKQIIDFIANYNTSCKYLILQDPFRPKMDFHETANARLEKIEEVKYDIRGGKKMSCSTRIMEAYRLGRGG
jgi:SAM-dependent methyltransferase